MRSSLQLKEAPKSWGWQLGVLRETSRVPPGSYRWPEARTEAESTLYGHPQRSPHTFLLFKIKVSSVKTWVYCIYPTDGLSFSFHETCPKCTGLLSYSFPRVSRSHILLGIQGECLLTWELAEPPPPSQHGQTCVAAPRHLRRQIFLQPKTPQMGASRFSCPQVAHPPASWHLCWLLGI